MEEDLLDVFQRDYLRNSLNTGLTNRISNSKLYKKCSSIPLSRAIIRERLIFQGNILWVWDDKLPKLVLVGQPSTATLKAGRSRMGWQDVRRKDLRKMELLGRV